MSLKSFIFFLILYSSIINSAAKPFKFEKERVVYFGNFGLQFGTFTLINISPTIGYRFTDKLTAGAGPLMNYVSDNYSKFSNFSYGARIYGKYFIFENAYLTGDYQLINNYWQGNNIRTWIDIPLVGGGYRQSLGGNFFLDFSVLWNLNNQANGYYSNPILRGGVSFR
jgi:hypothetical protein